MDEVIEVVVNEEAVTSDAKPLMIYADSKKGARGLSLRDWNCERAGRFPRPFCCGDTEGSLTWAAPAR